MVSGGRAARSAYLVALLAALAATTPSALARPVVRVTIEEYVVDGRTGAELMAEIRRKGPRHGIMTRAMAQTRYGLAFDLDAAPRRGQCRVLRAEVRLDITYHYPRLARPLSPAMQKRWQAFLAGVRRHEEGHGDLARRMAAEVERALLRMAEPGGREACAIIRQKAPRLAERIFERYETMQKRYDAAEHRNGGPIDQLVERLVRGGR